MNSHLSTCFYTFAAFMFFQETVSQREGEPCVVNDGPGVCKLLDGCPYADNLVRDLKKPTHCSYSGKREVVCCPAMDIPPYALGKFGRFFSNTKNGRLIATNTTCYYEGKLPMKCCRNLPDPPLPPEPAACPAIAGGGRKTNQLVWDKCVEYERLAAPCVSNGKGGYSRHQTCAQSDIAFRVTSGDPAGLREFPHMALLGYRAEGQSAWVAAGSLISDRYILTAAHVVTHQKWGEVQFARLGLLQRSDLSQGVVCHVVTRKMHPGYRFSFKYHDIALLGLDRRVPLSPDIRPACLPTRDLTQTSDTLIVTGWGRTGRTAPLSDILLKTHITAFEGSACEGIVDRKLLPQGWKDDQMLCAGSDEDQKNDTCEGDSGGPLQSYAPHAVCQYVLAGVVSWGPECGVGEPAAYTRVSHYVDWIVSIVWPNY